MRCTKCIRFIKDKSQVDHNIKDILHYIEVTKSLQESLDKSSKLSMLQKHLKSNTKILEDLILILSVSCPECVRQG